MKKLISSFIAVGVFSPITVSAQQVNNYQVCHTYQENYVPGRYTNNGYYVQGGVYTVKNTVNCQTGEVYSSEPYNRGSNIIYQPPVERPRTVVLERRRRVCNPAAGALMGAGLASALSGGTGWSSNSSWSNYYGRRSSSGNWNNSYRNNNGWTMFGAGLGALAYSC